MQRKSFVIAATAALAVSAAFAQQAGRENFLLQQTQAELNRVSSQMDVIQSNYDELARRVSRLEGGGDTRGLASEIEALKSQIADLKRQLSRQRGEIVSDLSGRMAKMQKAQTPPPAPKTRTVVIGPHREYVVQSGDTLSVIAQAFNVPISKIREMNNLKSDNLRVGQKLNVPK